MLSRACHRFAVIIFFVLLGAGSIYAGNIGVVLTWDNAPADETIAEYHVFYGTQSGVYTNSMTAADPSGVVIDGLQGNQTYYFAVMAIDTDGHSSPLSGEVSLTLLIPQAVFLNTQIYTDANGVPYLMAISGTNSTTTDWKIESSPDLVHWTEVTGNHGINILDYEYINGTGQMFYRVVDK